MKFTRLFQYIKPRWVMLLLVLGLLMLDEATAMFDPQGEEEFIDGCSDLLDERTVILITHRPANVALANRVVKMQDARVLPGVHF